MKSFVLISIACFVGSFTSAFILRVFFDSKIKKLKDKLNDKETVISALKQFISGTGNKS